MAVVVDASAVVELLLRSPAAPAVEAAILSTPAFAPELLDAEVLAAIVGLDRGGKMTSPDGARAIEALLGSPITRVPHAGLLSDAWARRANLSPYDALYVALAARLQCPLVTADRKLAGAPGLGVTITVVEP